jgi:hypothetical protein
MAKKGVQIIVKNVFKNDELPSKNQFTQLWIEIINQLEKDKAINIKKV